VLFASLAAAVAFIGPAVPRRVQQLLPRTSEPSPASGPSPIVVRGAALLAGVALWAVVGGPVGVGIGLAAVGVGPRLLGRLGDDESDTKAVVAELPLALDLLAACLVGGATSVDAVRAVATALPGPCGARLARVGAALGVGSPAAEAWRALGEGPGPAGAAARALTRAAEGGAPVAASVVRVAEDARREAVGRAERAARRAGVLAVGPLGLCFLPAFLLLGIVPAIAGLAGSVLSSL
jgi:pilus assembly protein TadC